MQPWDGKFFTLLGKAGSNVVESAAFLREFVAASHERWAAVAEHPLCREASVEVASSRRRGDPALHRSPTPSFWSIAAILVTPRQDRAR